MECGIDLCTVNSFYLSYKYKTIDIFESVVIVINLRYKFSREVFLRHYLIY